MLKSVFNDKAEHLKQLDFDYSIKGDIEIIGRMVTANFVAHKSTHFIQEKEKRYRHLLEFLHLQNVLAELDEQLARIDDLLNKIADKNDLIRDGFALLKTDDIDGMSNLLSGQNKSVHSLNDDEIRDATQSLIIDTIDRQQELQNALEHALIAFEDRIDGLDHNSEEYHNYKAELDIQRSELQKIATQQNLNYDDAERYLWQSNNTVNKVLKIERSQNIKNDRKTKNKNLNDSDLYGELDDGRVNDPSPKETKLLFSNHNRMGLN